MQKRYRPVLYLQSRATSETSGAGSGVDEDAAGEPVVTSEAGKLVEATKMTAKMMNPGSNPLEEGTDAVLMNNLSDTNENHVPSISNDSYGRKKKREMKNILRKTNFSKSTNQISPNAMKYNFKLFLKHNKPVSLPISRKIACRNEIPLKASALRYNPLKISLEEPEAYFGKAHHYGK